MPNREDDQIASNIQKARKEYRRQELSAKMLGRCPFNFFKDWFDQAVAAGISEPNAMALATANSSGNPHVRYVLMKDFSVDGLVFYTNSKSSKGEDIEENPLAASVFYWRELERQVRVEGTVSLVSDEIVDTYFASRPRQAQLGAIASIQSAPLANRSTLEKAVRELDSLNGSLSRPEFWRGYCISPERFEFWQGRESRLHDRFEYNKDTEGNWNSQRLYP